jgi:maltooligosyltrehalose trehalohydrolase
LLLGPQTPLLFMGQEFGTSKPFHYFADHEPELAKLVGTGRREFMSQFPGHESLHEPAEEITFLQCKLDWDEVEQNVDVVQLHRDLIRLRRDDPVFSRQDRSAIEGSVIGPEALLLRWMDAGGDDRLALFNLGRDIELHPIAEPLLALPTGRQWEVLWSSEEPRYGGLGMHEFDGRVWRIPGHAAVVFRASAVLVT